MPYVPTNPVIVQSDKTILLEVANPLYGAARDALMAFAELEKSPEHVHTYRITPLSLWNAAAAGITGECLLAGLARYSQFDLPPNIRHEIIDYIGRYGRVRLIKRHGRLLLTSDEPHLIALIWNDKRARPHVLGLIDDHRLEVRPVTVSSYQILVHRRCVDEGFPHFRLFNARDWGLIIYDEVHLLPAAVFRITTEIQARRRLGLTATLVREDGRAADVFTLLGLKK